MVAEHVVQSATLQRLIADVREVVAAAGDAPAISWCVAERVQLYLEDTDLLLPERREPDPNHYHQHILHVELDGSSRLSRCAGCLARRHRFTTMSHGALSAFIRGSNSRQATGSTLTRPATNRWWKSPAHPVRPE
ncbi:hypothetical protein BH23CHL2_BH23CHL2_22020 [soil metagenome]